MTRYRSVHEGPYKGIRFTALLILILSIGYCGDMNLKAQDSYRAKAYRVFVQDIDTVTGAWEKKPIVDSELNCIIKYSESNNAYLVYTQETQEYTIMRYIETKSDAITRIRCMDDDGVECNISLVEVDVKGEIYHTFEIMYSDLRVTYFVNIL